MRFNTPATFKKEEQPVDITLEKQLTGSIAIMANGCTIAYIRKDGIIELNCMDSCSLAGLGFQIDSLGQVKIC